MKWCLAAALCLLSPGALAQTFDYTFIELDYVDARSEFDGVELDGDGFGLMGSLAATDRLALIAQYEDIDFDRGTETRSWALGINFHAPLFPQTDIVLGVHYLDQEESRPAGTEDDAGHRLLARLKHMIAPAVELTVDAARVDIFGASDTSYGLSLGFGDVPQFVVGYQTDDETDALIAGVQYAF